MVASRCALRAAGARLALSLSACAYADKNAARIRLGDLTPDMMRLKAEVKQITHAIRMAAYNAQTTLARALDDHYSRAGDEANALIREALTASGDFSPATAGAVPNPRAWLDLLVYSRRSCSSDSSACS